MFTGSLNMPNTFKVQVNVTNNRGFTPEEVAARCVDKIVEVGDNAAPEIRDQAHAFKAHLEKVITFYMKEAIKSDRTTVCNAIKNAGHEKLAEMIRRL